MNEPQSDSQTAEKLILAGIELFGEYGFRGTTTRMVAEAAGANIGSIAYYFDNKHGLYLAAARHISEQLRARLELDALGATLRQEEALDGDRAQWLLQALVRRMVRLFMEAPEARSWLMLVMREQAAPTEAFEILYQGAFERAHLAITTLISALTGRAASEQRVILEAHALVGQIVFLLVGRTPLMRRLGRDGQFDPDTVALAEAVMVDHVRRLRGEDCG